MRTPYGKPSGGMDRYVKAGYIVVTQDVRGRYASDGQWESFLRFDTHDAEDGFRVDYIRIVPVEIVVKRVPS